MKILRFFPAVAALCLWNLPTASGGENTRLKAPLQGVGSLLMECEIRCSFTDQFLKENSKPGVLKVNGRLERIKIQTKAGRYLISQNAEYRDNSQSGLSQMGYDGNYTYNISGNVDRIISITHRKFTELSTSYLGYDALLFPYNFLFESKNAEWFVWQDIGEIQNPELLKTFLEKYTPVEYLDSHLGTLHFYEIKRPQYTETVSLSPKHGNLPVYYSRTDANGKKVLAYQALQLAKKGEGTAEIHYAPRATIWMYLAGWHVATYDLSISKLEAGKDLPDEVFEMDPSMASAVWDSDRKQYITIPQ